MDVRLPNGKVIRNVPEGTSMEDIRAKAIQGGFATDADFPSATPYEFSGRNMVGNIPSSAKQFAADIITPFMHPIQTAGALQSIAQGGVENMLPMPELPPEYKWGKTDKQQAAGQFADFYKDRYGSIENAKKTLENDPVGALADLSGVVALGGMAAARAPGAVGRAGTVTANVGRALDPVNAALNPVRKAVGAMVPENMPVEMLNSAVKWNTTTDMRTRNQHSRTMLEERIPPTYEGVERAWRKIDDLNSKIDEMIAMAQEEGKRVPRESVFRYIQEAKREARMGADPKTDMSAIDKVVNDLDEVWYNYDMKDFTPTELQNFKKDLYNKINFDRENQSSTRGSETARREIARASREDLEAMNPEIGPTNRREGALLDLVADLPQKASRIENNNVLSLGAGANTGLGYLLGDVFGAPGVGTGLGLMSSFIEKPKVKASLAQNLYGLQKAGLLDAPITPYVIRQGLLQSGRANPYD